MSVEVRDGRILWIGSASDWAGNRTNIRVVDGRARTLIPGLMDCHVHYSSPGGPDWIARFTDPLTEIAIRAVELAEASLRSGVTTARDVGAPHAVNIRLARTSQSGEIRAPRIRAAGTWIAHRGTYVSFARQFSDAGELRSAIKAEVEAGGGSDQGRAGRLERRRAASRKTRDSVRCEASLCRSRRSPQGKFQDCMPRERRRELPHSGAGRR